MGGPEGENEMRTFTRHEVTTRSEKHSAMFSEAWEEKNNDGWGFAPEDFEWYSPAFFAAFQDGLELYVQNGVIYGVGDANGPWACRIGQMVD